MAIETNLSVLDTFTCLGDKCPEHCCIEWNIPVDTDTLEKWESLNESDRRYVFDSSSLQDNENSTDGESARFLEKDESGYCVMLGGNGLCQLQASLGHDVLPKMCRDYPRIILKNQAGFVRSAQLSCPDIVSNALFNQSETPLFNNMDSLVRSMLGSYNPVEQLYGELGRFFHEVMGFDKFTANIKLYLLSTSLSSLYQKSQSSAGDELWTFLSTELHTKPKDKLFNIGKKLKSSGHGVKPDDYLAYWQVIRKVIRGCKTLVLSEVLQKSELLNLLNNDMPGEEIHRRLTEAFSTMHKQVSRKYSKVFSRYTELALVNRGYPLSPVGDNQFVSFASALISLSMVNLLMACHLDEKGALEESDIKEIIWRVERQTVHNKAIQQLFKDFPELLELGNYHRILLDLF